MSNILVINASGQETRVALIEQGTISEYYLERSNEKGIVGNIYKGRVVRVLPGMQAAFVDIGLEKAAFLYVADIVSDPSFPGFSEEMDIQAGATEGDPLDAEDLPEPHEHDDALHAEHLHGEPGDGEHDHALAGEHRADASGPAASPGDAGQPVARMEASDASAMLAATASAEGAVSSAPPDPTAPPSGALVPPPAPPAPVPAGDARQAAPAADSQLAPAAMDSHAAGHADEASLPLAEEVDDDEVDDPEGEGDEEEDEDEDLDEGDAAHAAAEEAVAAEAGGPVTADAAADGAAGGMDAMDVAAGADLGAAASAATPPAAAAPASGQRGVPGAPGERSAARRGRRRGGRGRRRPGEERGPKPGSGDAAPSGKPERRPGGGNGSGNGASAHGGHGGGGGGGRGGGHGGGDKRPSSGRRAQIQDLLKEGDEVLVQVVKDPIGTKGARITCHISLPGRHLVFMPTVDHVGISRRIENEKERRRLRELVDKYRPEGTGFIVRTVAENEPSEKLTADIKFLLGLWNEVGKKRDSMRSPACLHPDLDLILRSIRDLFSDDVKKVVIDDRSEYERVRAFVEQVAPELASSVELYQGDEPIFDEYGIEQELIRASNRKVWLKSGGYIVIDQTEALVAIDVNSGRYTGKKGAGASLEDTITKINCEAAKEIVYQLRLRNIGGIIILDFIDMDKGSNRDKVFKTLQEALLTDRAKTNVLKISDIGLVEMTRKRVRESVGRLTTEGCPTCDGRGHVRSKTTIAYEIMREAQRAARKHREDQLIVSCHPEVAKLLQGPEREAMRLLMMKLNKSITVRPQPQYHVEQYDLYGKWSRPELQQGDRRQQPRGGGRKEGGRDGKDGGQGREGGQGGQGRDAGQAKDSGRDGREREGRDRGERDRGDRGRGEGRSDRPERPERGDSREQPVAVQALAAEDKGAGPA